MFIPLIRPLSCYWQQAYIVNRLKFHKPVGTEILQITHLRTTSPCSIKKMTVYALFIQSHLKINRYYVDFTGL